MLLVTAPPNNAHQVVATRLPHLLAQALEPSAGAEGVAVGAIQRVCEGAVQND